MAMRLHPRAAILDLPAFVVPVISIADWLNFCGDPHSLRRKLFVTKYLEAHRRGEGGFALWSPRGTFDRAYQAWCQYAPVAQAFVRTADRRADRAYPRRSA